MTKGTADVNSLLTLIYLFQVNKISFPLSLNKNQMKNQPIAIVQEMFAAFRAADPEKFIKTVSEDTIWTYHGTHKIPKATFRGKEGVGRFLNKILTTTEIIKFDPQQFVVEDNMVVVIGEEQQKVKKTGEELKQRWVQVYTIENNLISQMEEFATTEVV